MRPLEAALGTVTSRTLKPEYHKTQAVPVQGKVKA